MKANNTMNEDGTQPVTVEVKHYPPRVGMMSLIYIFGKDYPLNFGNYCSIADGPYLVNCWAENLEEWARRNPDADTIEVTVVEHNGRRVGIVTDPRLADWCNDKLCITGQGWPSVAALRKVGEIMGLPIANMFCGCEADTEAPHIGESWSRSAGAQCHCGRCGRTWQIES